MAASALGLAAYGSIASFIVAVLGAMVLIFILKALSSEPTTEDLALIAPPAGAA